MVSILIKALLSIGTKLLATMASEELLKWALFKIAGAVVESTETPHDDEFLAKLKQQYDKQ